MRCSQRVIAFVCLCVLGVAPAAHAQDEIDPSEAARFRFGALRFTPSIALSSIGVDNNVFNEAADPKSDTTAAVGPAVNLWLKMGRSRLSGKASGQYLYFNKYDNQRSWNTASEGRWELPLARLTPFVAGQLTNTKDRAGYEIDSRVRQHFGRLDLGTRLRLSGKTELELGVGRSQTQYDDNDVFLGDLVSQTLDRRTDAENLRLRIALTPLTTFVIRGDASQERFDFAPERNADTISVMPGFEFKPQALISGTVFVGAKKFNGLRETIPDFTGVVADVGATYVVHSSQFQVKVSRDLAFSYELLQPYYALTDSGLAVTQRVTTKWDLLGRVSRQSLAYRNLATTTLGDRTDHSWVFGGGIGYRVAETVRVGLDANYYRRQSASLAFRDYEGLRVGASFSYGLTQ
jgi:hypothetical protein